jgi:hypothetical protein
MTQTAHAQKTNAKAYSQRNARRSLSQTLVIPEMAYWRTDECSECHRRFPRCERNNKQTSDLYLQFRQQIVQFDVSKFSLGFYSSKTRHLPPILPRTGTKATEITGPLLHLGRPIKSTKSGSPSEPLFLFIVSHWYTCTVFLFPCGATAQLSPHFPKPLLFTTDIKQRKCKPRIRNLSNRAPNKAMHKYRHNVTMRRVTVHHCCCGKAVIITYFCVYVYARVSLPTTLSACAVLNCQLRPRWLHHILRHYLINGKIFRKKIADHRTCFDFL